MDHVQHIGGLSLSDPFVLANLGQVHYCSGNLPVAGRYLKKAVGISREPEIKKHFLSHAGMNEEIALLFFPTNLG